MKKELGQYFLGHESVRVFWDTNSRDGGCQLPGDWVKAGNVYVGQIVIGFSLSWSEVVETLLHEAFEYAACKQGCRFTGDYRTNSSPSHGLFIMTHDQFSEITAQVGVFSSIVLPDLAAAYKKHKK